MTRPLPRLVHTAMLLLLGFAAIYAQLIPLGPGGDLVAPDLLFCIVVAWTIRAPAMVAFGLVVGLGLFADLMLSRPVGLGALALLLATEAFRAHRDLVRGSPFVVEWLAALAAFAAAHAFMHLALRLTFADVPDLGASLRYLVATAFAYPIVAFLLTLGLGLGTAFSPELRRQGRLS
jgi:rod shape-determining protein MreD